MKLFVLPAFALFLAASPASAIVALGTSNQTFVLTGMGPNALGQGQSSMTWGTCAFDGTNTSCTLSGQYTGLGNGGSYSLVVSYAGNGAFPLIAITSAGSDVFSVQATGNYSLVTTLVQNGAPTLKFYNFSNFPFIFSSPTCTLVALTSCSPGQVGQTPNATIGGYITGTFDSRPIIRTQSGVISAGGYGAFPSITSATWIEIYGSNLATTLSQTWGGADFVGNQAPAALGGTTVTVGGKAAYVNYVSPGQVNVQVPSGLNNGQQPVVVTTGGGSSVAYSVNVNTTQPGLLAPSSFIVRGNQYVVALLSNTLTYILPVSLAGVQTARAKVGDKLTLYGIGFGPVTPDVPAGQIDQINNALTLDFKITFAGVPAVISYAGLGPGNVGLYQFNVTVPSGPFGDTVPIAFTLNGVPSQQTLLIAIGL